MKRPSGIDDERRTDQDDYGRPELIVLAMAAALGGAVMGFLVAGELLDAAWLVLVCLAGCYLGWSVRRIMGE